MPLSPARELAFRILERVEQGQAYAIDLLQAPRVSRLKEADRRLATEIVMGVLRRRGDLDYPIEQLSGKPITWFDPAVLEVLRAGVYQIRYLESVPKYAAVNESVELVKRVRKTSAAGLVNAVLRKCEPALFKTERFPGGPACREMLESARRSLPEWIRERWQRNFGEAASDALAVASFGAPRTWLRLAGLSFDRDSMQRELAQKGVQTQTSAYTPRALRVESGSVTSTQAWREGRVTMQDEASQLVGELTQPEPGQWALDLCAAPGLKALQMAESMTAGTVVACDRKPSRMRTLHKIIGPAWPVAVSRDCVILDAGHPLPFSRSFDRVLVDAPCSGTGTLARNPEIKWRLRPEDLPRLAAHQARILCNGLEALADGGRLTYSTCSLEREENEEVVSRALEEVRGCRQLAGEELRHEAPHLAGLIGDDGAFRTFPGCEPHDGFFAVVIVRE